MSHAVQISKNALRLISSSNNLINKEQNKLKIGFKIAYAVQNKNRNLEITKT